MTTVIEPKWHTTAEVAEMLSFGLSKTKMLLLTGEIRSVKVGRNRRILLGLGGRVHPARLLRRRRVGGMTGKRGNGEGSIYPYKNGFAAYVWVTKPDGKRARKYAYGKTREEVHDKWLNLHAAAKQGPVATRHRTLAAFLTYWLESIVKPNLAPLSYVSYEGYVRLYIAPHLGSKRLDKLTVRDVREWLTKLGTVCQCCAQGKDEKRAAARRKCCAVGDCCESYPSRRVIQASRDALRAALTHAVTEEEIGKNVASLVKVPKPRRRRIKPWSVAEAEPVPHGRRGP